MTLAPLPHHTRVVAHLKAHEPDLWAWFTSAPSWSELLERTRLLLLKRAVRLDRATHHHLYAAADHALAALATWITTDVSALTARHRASHA